MPLQALAFETLAPRLRTTAASLINLARNVGGSVGIAVSAQLVRMTQVATQIWQQYRSSADHGCVLLPSIGVREARRPSSTPGTRQAVFIAYLDDFKLMMIVTFAVHHCCC